MELTPKQEARMIENCKRQKREQEEFHKANIDKVTVNKTCSCGTVVTNDNCELIGQNNLGLWFNCPCGSSMIQ